MRFSDLKQEKGVAGLTILLSLIVMLFVIGLLVMIFSMMGGELRTSDMIQAGESETATDTSLVLASEEVTLTDCDNANQGAITSITTVYNDTTLVDSANYSFYNCTLNLTGGTFPYNESLENATYTYSYAGTSWTVINDTNDALSDVTDWFSIFIVIGAMVVLILLTVIIIVAIRGSGMISGGGAVRTSNVGSA
jgi:flagellar basal body-associated protein FliL